MTTDGYDSPIKVYQLVDEQYSYLENKVFEVVKAMDVNVDKEELFRALAYDRNQYQKGYDAGYKKALEDVEKMRDISCVYIRGGDSR